MSSPLSNTATIPAHAAPPATPGPGAPDDERRPPPGSDMPDAPARPDPGPDVAPTPVDDPTTPVPVREPPVLTPAVQRVLAWHRQHMGLH